MTVTGRQNLRRAFLILSVAYLNVAGFSACSSGDSQDPPPNATGGSETGGVTGSGGVAVNSGGTTNSGGASTAGASSGGAPSTGGINSGGGGASGGAAAAVGSSGAALGGIGGTSGAAGSGGLPPGPCQPPANIKQPIEKLSATGCMDPNDPKKMADFVIPYDVNSPLWSDNAVKTRGMVVPAGSKIHVKNCAANPDECLNGVEDDGMWVFPIGTVFIKNFLFDSKLVETRLFVRKDQRTWVGYGYQWDEAQTDATVVPDEARKVMFNTGTRSVEWTYPSRYDCMVCHNKNGGYSLGPETRQLNRTLNGEHLLDKLEGLGLFDAPLPKPYLAALPTPYESPEGKPPAGASNEELTRSYLHANCAYCHRPEDPSIAVIDLRYGVPLQRMNLCNLPPMKGGAGLETGSLLTPGKPEESVMWARVNTLNDQDRMPQIGTYVVDQPGTKLIADWITSIQGCP